LKKNLSGLGEKINQKLEKDKSYAKLLSESIKPLQNSEVKLLVDECFKESEKQIQDFMTLQMLLYLGKVDVLSYNNLGVGPQRTIIVCSEQCDLDSDGFFIDNLEEKDLKKWKEVVESKDYVGKNLKIGVRKDVNEISYLVRYPKNKDDSKCLGMKIENRQIKFFPLTKENQSFKAEDPRATKDPPEAYMGHLEAL
jgi:hypothetical protein